MHITQSCRSLALPPQEEFCAAKFEWLTSFRLKDRRVIRIDHLDTYVVLDNLL